MTLKFNEEFAINPQSVESGGGGTTTPVFNGTVKEAPNRFKVFKNTSYSIGGEQSVAAGVQLDLSNVNLPSTINSAAFICKIRPINQQGTANAIFSNFDVDYGNSLLKIQLNGSNLTFALFDRLTNTNNTTTDNYAVTYDSLGKNAYWVAMVFDGTKNYGYIIQDTSDSNPIENRFCPIPLTDNGWHKTNGFTSNGQNGSFLKSGNKYYIGTGSTLESATVQIFSGIIHLDSVELQVNGQRVWQLIK